MKNITLPSKDPYHRSLIGKVESVIKCMQWKAHFFLHGGDSNSTTNRFGLNSACCPPQITEMKDFEDDLTWTIKNINFRKVHDQFLSTLSNNLKKVRQSRNLMIFANKTWNLYEMDAQAYDKLMTEGITKSYQLGDEKNIEDINQKLQEIANELKITDRIETTAKRAAFVTLKDHKENFDNHPTCRLINPAKSELGKVSKTILDRINNDIRSRTLVNQWKNSAEVINWFQCIPNKQQYTFLSFDIVDFYPSISESLVNKSISWAKTNTEITGYEIAIIKHAKKSILFNRGRPRFKNSSGGLFDVTVGSFDGAEICDLVGLYILDSLTPRFGRPLSR